jgi:hypothetical protein
MALLTSNVAQNEKGQAVTEYLLLLSILVATVVALMAAINSAQVGPKLVNFFTTYFAHAYQYGKPETLGYNDPGGPFKHPRAITPDATQQNFRIFFVNQASRQEEGGE